MQNFEDNDVLGNNLGSNNKLASTADLLTNKELTYIFLIVYDNEKDKAN